MKPCVYNLCPHTVKVQREAPVEGPFEYTGTSLTKEFKSDGVWRCKPMQTPRMENILGVPCFRSNNFSFSESELESLPVTLPLDQEVILIVSTEVGQVIERTFYGTVNMLLQDHPHVTIVSPASGGLDECTRLENGQIDVSFMWKLHTRGSMFAGFF